MKAFQKLGQLVLAHTKIMADYHRAPLRQSDTHGSAHGHLRASGAHGPPLGPAQHPPPPNSGKATGSGLCDALAKCCFNAAGGVSDLAKMRLSYATTKPQQRSANRAGGRRDSIDKLGDEAMKVFLAADKSGDGVLQAEEMPEMLRGMGISGKPAERIKDLIHVFFDEDTDGMGAESFKALNDNMSRTARRLVQEGKLENHDVATNAEVLLLYVIVQQLQHEMEFKDQRMSDLEEWIHEAEGDLMQIENASRRLRRLTKPAALPPMLSASKAQGSLRWSVGTPPTQAQGSASSHHSHGSSQNLLGQSHGQSHSQSPMSSQFKATSIATPYQTGAGSSSGGASTPTGSRFRT